MFPFTRVPFWGYHIFDNHSHLCFAAPSSEGTASCCRPLGKASTAPAPGKLWLWASRLDLSSEFGREGLVAMSKSAKPRGAREVKKCVLNIFK